ncbi:ThuA domain-containing protein [Maribellus sp. YY47]|uniref:ThuA domain-containing protein n=1 Tax=Maribellus sp. YY47 TaxID=2929486 RepID=UPI0020017642|nr:ThuA domain-containing protein [Maribellus sp. YY47]MCK3683863.1 ThuA domain-containing protein [Maribellus sp. YY47]
MKKQIFFILLTLTWNTIVFAQETTVKGKRILIYTKTGEGYVHANIAASVNAIQEICDKEQIRYDVSDNPETMTKENLEKYDALFFANASNKVFETQTQRDAFQAYCRSGKGFGGIHAANTVERDWPWFVQLIGGKFVRHPKYQAFDVLVVDPNHPSTQPLPKRWTVEDECYLSDQLNPDIHILMVADLNTLEDDKLNEYPGNTFYQSFPLVWCHQFEGGRQWFSALGHDPEFYKDPVFRAHIRGGILWLLGVE